MRGEDFSDLARRHVFAGVALDADDSAAILNLNQLG
jgi:hypothetical protein